MSLSFNHPLRLLLILAWSITAQIFAEELTQVLPEELDTTGSASQGLANGGVAGEPYLGAVRLNPALLALTKTYRFAAGYQWPSAGREFYHLGIIDGKSSKVTAGVQYTGFANRFGRAKNLKGIDTPILRRLAIGAGTQLRGLTIGGGAQYIEGVVLDQEGEDLGEKLSVRKGWTFGGGLIIGLGGQLRFASSVENLMTGDLKSMAPRTLRAGFSYLLGKYGALINLDFRHRDQIEKQYASYSLLSASLLKDQDQKDEQQKQSSEKMLIFSGSIPAYGMLAIKGGYGQTIGSPSSLSRRQLAAGLSYRAANYDLELSALQPKLGSSNWSTGLALSFVTQI